MAQGKAQLKFERNPCISSEIIATRRRQTTDDRRRTNCDFMSSADIWPRGSNNQNLKGIHAIGSEIIDVTDGRTTHDGQKLHTMSSTDIV